MEDAEDGVDLAEGAEEGVAASKRRTRLRRKMRTKRRRGSRAACTPPIIHPPKRPKDALKKAADETHFVLNTTRFCLARPCCCCEVESRAHSSYPSQVASWKSKPLRSSTPTLSLNFDRRIPLSCLCVCPLSSSVSPTPSTTPPHPPAAPTLSSSPTSRSSLPRLVSPFRRSE